MMKNNIYKNVSVPVKILDITITAGIILLAVIIAMQF